MKSSEKPGWYDAYGVGTPGNLTTTQGALAFMRIADIFARARWPIAVSPADLPPAPIADMISEGSRRTRDTSSNSRLPADSGRTSASATTRSGPAGRT